MLVLIVLGAASCRRERESRSELPPEGPAGVRPVRVLVASSVDRARVRSDGDIVVEDGDKIEVSSCPAGEWLTVEMGDSGDIHVAEQSFPGGSVMLVPDGTGRARVSVACDGEWSAEVEYPGRLHVSVGEDGGIEVVNHVDVEQYVACVVAHEVWPGFETEAYRAQAIAARTYVLYQMARQQGAPFDIGATEGSQVYQGIRGDRVGRRATGAVAYTRGVVCTWRDEGEDKLFSTYYSAACGGVSQSAAIFGKADDIRPLAGGVRCDYCRIAPADVYRWGPVRLSCKEVLSRLTARDAEPASLGSIAAIEVIERTPWGRPARVRITGSSGQTHDMLAERFRLAVGSRVVRSTDCDIRVSGGEVIFEHGRGFGHGLGLCQWGMQGQALAGKRAGEILRFYYPGSRLTRVY